MRRGDAWRGCATVLGVPQGMGSKRILVPASGRPVLVDANQRALRSWQRELRAAMAETAPPEPLDCAVAVGVLVYLLRPLAHFRVNKGGRTLKEEAPRLPASGRDIDKVLRAVLDCGTSLWWRDDCRVAQASVARVFADGSPQRTEVVAWAAEAPAPRAEGQWELALVEAG